MTAIERLHHLWQLPPNWDSYGSPPIDPAVILVTECVLRRLLRTMREPEAVVPVSGGGVQLEWSANGQFFELLAMPTPILGEMRVTYIMGKEAYPETWEEGTIPSSNWLQED